jgi:nitrogen fixation protein FixH
VERAARWKWIAIICGLLGVQLCMSGVAVVLATGDPRQSVIPNYHQQAMHWNETAAAHHASELLGWTWEVSASNLADVYGHRMVTMVLRDATGKPISGVMASLELMHHAHGQEVQRIELAPVPKKPGTYEGMAVIRNNGIWQIDVRAVKEQQKFIGTTQQNWQFSKQAPGN